MLAAGTVALVYGIGRRAFDARTAMIGAALYALMPSAIFFAGVTLSETAFTFALMLAIWLIIEAAVRRRPALLVAAGIAIGYATLIRGQAVLVPLVAVPFWLWMSAAGADRGDRRRAAKDVLARVLLVGALAARRCRAVVDPELHQSRLAGADLDERRRRLLYRALGGGGRRGRKVDALVFRYPELPPAHAEARISNDGFREGLKYAATHPAREVVLSVRKLFWLYYSDDEALRWTDGHGERHVLSHMVFRALSPLSDVYYWLLLALALVGVRRSLSLTRDDAGATRLLLAVLVAYWTHHARGVLRRSAVSRADHAGAVPVGGGGRGCGYVSSKRGDTGSIQTME